MTGPGRLFWKLFLGNALLTAVVLGACALMIARELGRYNDEALTRHLTAQAELLRETAGAGIGDADSAPLDALAKRIGATDPDRVRVTFIRADGQVLGDSEAAPAEMESHADRPEVIAALRSGWGEDVRASRTLGKQLKYVAVRVGSVEAPLGAIRVAMGVDSAGKQAEMMRDVVWQVLLLGVVALVVFAMGLTRLWSIPIQQMTVTARSLSQGDLSARIPVEGSDEVADLGRSLNQMRDHLAAQLHTIDRQRQLLESLLAQLLEGVVVVGPDGRIVLINPTAIRLLGIASGDERPAIAFERLQVHELVSHPMLRELLQNHESDGEDDWSGVAAAGAHLSPLKETRVRLQTATGEISLLARSSDIRLPSLDAANGGMGERSTAARLLVLTDVSELTKAMQVKADFAANASHELRTPLSAIRGAVETLLEMDLAASAASARHFITMIDRHTSRMQAMVADLLDLSRLETSPDQFKPQKLSLRGQLLELHTRHAQALESKHMHWNIEIAPEVETVAANAHLLRLILDNLVDNAIKFTDPEGGIHIRCRQDTAGEPPQRRLVIEVTDNGCGIPHDQQDRVFERFYQVEVARSGSLRGTGLGLSIVRHAVAAMNGTAELRSKLGEGTTVTITIPQPD